jgi:hypothetical protein
MKALIMSSTVFDDFSLSAGRVTSMSQVNIAAIFDTPVAASTRVNLAIETGSPFYHQLKRCGEENTVSQAVHVMLVFQFCFNRNFSCYER